MTYQYMKIAQLQKATANGVAHRLPGGGAAIF